MDYSLIFSISSLVISVIIGVTSIFVMIRPHKHSLLISSIVEKHHTEVNVIITNKGLRPLVIKSFKVGYGPSQSNLQLILTDKLETLIKVNDGEIFEHSISRNRIIESIKNNSIKQYYNQRLWIGVVLSNGKTVFKLTSIDPSIIKNDYLPNAVDFISTDIFVGFEQMKPRIPLPLIAK